MQRVIDALNRGWTIMRPVNPEVTYTCYNPENGNDFFRIQERTMQALRDVKLITAENCCALLYLTSDPLSLSVVTKEFNSAYLGGCVTECHYQLVTKHGYVAHTVHVTQEVTHKVD